MREDMFKVIVERPRSGRSWATKSKLRYAPDDAPQRMSGKRIVTLSTRRTKHLNENLAPLKRYLMAQRGRRWDDVFSDICTHLDTGSTVKMHVREHLDDFIERKVRIASDGSWVSTSRWGSPIPPTYWANLYVGPADGIVKETSLLCRKLGIQNRREYWADQRRSAQECPQLVHLTGHVFLVQKNGIWFQYELKRVPTTAYGYPYSANEIYREICNASGQDEGPWQVIAKQQLSKKQLKTHSLKNTMGGTYE
ncbi:MAG: hypothetical protein ACSHXY_07815 [Alphaproteobacteria bacterium]